MPTIPKPTVLDAKQIELIQKFIRLANNNPNDHEANSAARKVCKMLEGYIFPISPVIQSTPPPPPPPSGRRDPWTDVMEEMRRQQRETADREAARNRETARNRQEYYDPNKWDAPPRSGTGRPPPGSERETKRGKTEQPGNMGEDDPFKAYREGFGAGWRPTTAQEEFFRGGNRWDFSGGFGQAEKRNLKCSKCGHTKSTRFRGPEAVWVCMECRGKEYTETKNG